MPPSNRKSSVTKNHPIQSTPRLLTLKEAAKWLGLSVWALRERIWAGQIPVIKFPDGRKMFVDVKDLETFIEKNKATIT